MTNLSDYFPSGAGGSGLPPVFVDNAASPYAASPGEPIFCDSSSGAITITLPVAPLTGDGLSIWDAGDAAGTNNITIARNGSTIDGAAEDFIINVSGGRVDLAFDGTTWQLAYTTPGASGFTGIKRVFLRPHKDLVITSATETEDYEPAAYWAFHTFPLSASSDSNAWSWVDLLPKNYDGNGIRARIYWVGSNTNTGNTEFNFTAVGTTGEGEAYGGVPGSSSESFVDAHCGVTNGFNITSWIDIPLAGWVYGDVTCVWGRRTGTSGADTFTGVAYLLGIEIEYHTNAATED